MNETGHRIFGSTPIPRYVQLADLFRQRVDKGEWGPGTTLPSIDELMEQFDVARVTIRQAIALLADEGLLSPQRGRGTFVTERQVCGGSCASRRRLPISSRCIVATSPEHSTIEESMASPVIKADEGIAAPKYFHMRRVHSRDGERYCVISMYIDYRVFRRAPARFRRELVLPVLTSLPGLKIASGRRRSPSQRPTLKPRSCSGSPSTRRWRRCAASFAAPMATVVYLADVTLSRRLHPSGDGSEAMTQALRLKSVRAHVYRAPIETPVATSFGIMRDRPMVLVEAEDHEGARGWGEVWCNFPHVGAEHRARLVEGVLAPLATAAPHESPEALFHHLTARNGGARHPER